jgi:uncharacterized iron-regulated protein
MRRVAFALALLTAGTVVPAVAADDRVPPPPENWRSPVLRDHPLVGALWDPRAQVRRTPAEAARSLAAADVVLLGEKHDNADHHRLQAWAVEALAARGRSPVVAFEMIPRDRGGRLADYLADGGDAAGLGPALDWAESGWPDWSIYRPIAETALAHDLRLAAADLPRADRREIAERGPEALPGALREAWALDVPWTEAMRRGLLEELSRAHCDVAPPEAFAGLSEVQRARDAALADSLLAGLNDADGAVLIAGHGHTRRDRGVPWFLERRAPELAVVGIAFVEVRDGVTDPAAYGDLGGHDLLWFTPRATDTDPCEAFAEQLERMRTGD